jgi:thiopeptide-type bacteriocin biosynthesis protein
MRGEAPPLVHSGFAVLRTPLLPVDDFVAWSRRILDAAEDASGSGGSVESGAALQALRDVVADPAFREAIRVASVSLSDEIDAWLTGARGIDARRLVHSLARYFSRATHRCTPFGLFAGCSHVAVGERTELMVGGRGGYTRRSRMDMDHLAELSRVVSADAECRRRVALRTNASVALLGGRLHYVDTRYAGRTRRYELTAADPTPEILDALACGRDGTTWDALAEPLLADGYATEEVDAFITELLDSKLLVPDLDPQVSGGDAATALADALEAAKCAPAVSAALREVCDRLGAIDAGGVGCASDYAAAVAPLRTLDVPVDESRLLQVDLYKPASGASIGRVVVEDAAEAAALLASITPGHDPLAAFAARFEARYETREVPLLEALDEEVGIGMPAAGADDGIMRRLAEARLQREGVLAELRCRAAYGRVTEVQLTDEDVRRLRWPDPRPLPDALALFGSVVGTSGEAVDRGDYRLFVTHTTGPSGARFLGRFAHLDPLLEEQIRAHLAAEEALRPDAVFAEIIHLPQGRIGNVIARPLLRAHEIHYLGRGGADREHQLDPADLRISVHRGRVTLRSARLDREVHPRLSTAHNYHGDQELPVYRFLCTLQDHRNQGTAHWDWGAQRGAAFLPRVARGRLVLSAATWNLSAREVPPLAAAAEQWDAAPIQAWRRERELPRFALLVQGDHRLPVDFDNPVSALVFARLLKGKEAATLVEAPHLDADARCTRGPEGSFTNEIVVPLLRRAPVPRAGDDARAQRSGRSAARGVARAYPPGSEWLYAKLYCGRGSADRVLREVVAPVVRQARAELPLRGWFFLRYADPDFHIRLRFRTGPRAAPRMVELLGSAAAPAVASGRLARLVYDTYLPEVERYGGPEAIGIAEAVFSRDSDAALALVAADDEASALREVPRDLAALAGIDRLLADAGMALDDRMPLLERVLGDVPAAVRQTRSMEFRQCRAAVTRMLGEGEDDASRAVAALLAARSAGVRPLLARLRALEAAGELQAPFENVLLSLSHMWVNRTVADGAAIEPLLYDRLYRAYRGLAGRAHAASAAG